MLRLWRDALSAAGVMIVLMGGAQSVSAQSDVSTPPAPIADVAAPLESAQQAGIAPADLGFRFHGYLRSGFGVDATGKGQQPFAAPLAGSKYRLGNEAETYLETTFNYGTTSEGEDPAYFDTRVTLAY